jgi:hypothetical protein
LMQVACGTNYLLGRLLEGPPGRPTWRRFENPLMAMPHPELPVTPINHLLVLSQPNFVHQQVQNVLSRKRIPPLET